MKSDQNLNWSLEKNFFVCFDGGNQKSKQQRQIEKFYYLILFVMSNKQLKIAY